MGTQPASTPGLIDEANPPETGAWYAWNNMMPLQLDHIHVLGSVDVPNVGVYPELVLRVAQGASPSVLLLELRLRQQAGIWPNAVVRKQVQHRAVLRAMPYSRVVIYVGSKVLVEITPETVHLASPHAKTLPRRT
ncbi:MAG: hypothetical protein ABL986_16815 [Vicinamibacterales bacterium]